MEFFKILKRAWYQPTVVLSDGIECLSIWFGSRKWDRILLNFLPIAIPVTCIIVMIALGKQSPKKVLVSQYLKEASTSSSSSDRFQKMCYSRVLQLEPSNLVARFHIGMDLQSKGALGKANWMMQPLAKSDSLPDEIRVLYAGWVLTNDEAEKVGKAIDANIKETQDPVEPAKTGRSLSSSLIASFQQDGTDLGLLQSALDADPSNPEIGTQVLKMKLTSTDATPEFVASLEEMSQSDKAKTVSKVMLAHIRVRKREYSQAKALLEEAQTLSPNSILVLNNLSMILTVIDPPELERGRKIIEEAIKLNGDDPELHHSRGKILMNLKETQEAIHSFEQALVLDPSRSKIREALIKAYESEGLTQLAEAQRKLLK